MSFTERGLKQTVLGLRKKEFSCLELTQYYLENIEKKNPQLNAVVHINQGALEWAKKLDQQGLPDGSLAGLPLGFKDLFCTKGLPTTAASRILSNFVPPYSATCVEALAKQGAFVLAKLNMDEFAMGSSNEASSFGSCKNPWNLEFVPGGSSGGSAAAVAAGMVPAALGSDTGGSIRQPAHFCGITGVKPTYGSISRYGMIAFASSLDQAGPMARTVDDCALLLDAMIEQDPRDSTTNPRKVESLADLDPSDLKGLKVGLPKEYLAFDLNQDVKDQFEKTLKDLEAQGVEPVEVSLPHTEFSVPVYYLVATSEASSNLSRYDGVRYGVREEQDSEGRPINDLETLYTETRSKGFGEEVQRRILLGTFALSSGYYDAFYEKACRVRRLIYQDFAQALQSCDFILSPVATSPAFKIGEKISHPIEMYYNDVFTTAASLAGLPAMSLPVGWSQQSLPIGLQIMARPFQEKEMLSFAKSVESLVQFRREGQ